jgi:glycosyltransferase involved in cell wall biosynthesis
VSIRVAMDARMIRSSGIGTYIRGLLPGLVRARPDWQFTALGSRRDFDDLGWGTLANLRMVEMTSPIYTVRQQFELARRSGVNDLFWSPHYDAALMASGQLVVTIHDMFHLAEPHARGARALARRAYARAMYEAVRRRAAGIMYDSHFTFSEMERLVGRPRGRAIVVPVGIDAGWAQAEQLEAPHPRRYLLFVGNVKPHKNLRVLIDALSLIGADLPHDLVVIGRREGMLTVDADIAAHAASLGSRVHFVGEVPTDLLRAYVRHADTLVFPSLYEGFGLPPLEAMMAGCPCIVSRAASLPEVCGDAPLYFDPRDAGELAGQIRRVVTDAALAESLRTRGRARAAEYGWDRSVNAALGLFEEVLSNRRGSTRAGGR